MTKLKYLAILAILISFSGCEFAPIQSAEEMSAKMHECRELGLKVAVRRSVLTGQVYIVGCQP